MSYNFEHVSGGQSGYRPWTHWTTGDSIIARVINMDDVDQYGKNSYKVEIIECDFEKDVVVAQNKRKENVEYRAPNAGDIFTLNECGALKSAMDKVEVGDIIKVIYTGTSKLKTGTFAGADSHTMKVLRANKAAESKQSEEDSDAL